jgi:hypothetical protein
MGILRAVVVAIICSLIIVPQVFAAMPVNPSYVSADATTANYTYPTHACTLADPCGLGYANSNAAADDIVYLRGGTYNIASGGKGINPTNSGSSGHVITFSGYEDEEVILQGQATSATTTIYGIYLNDSYIKVTKIKVTNVHTALSVDGGDYNEISYCEFYNARDFWADVFFSGTAKNTAGHYENSATMLYDTDQTWDYPASAPHYDNICTGAGTPYECCTGSGTGTCVPWCTGSGTPEACCTSLGNGSCTEGNGYARRIYNVTDKSVGYATDGFVSTNLASHYGVSQASASNALTGGTDNHWDTGDSYQMTFNYGYDPAYVDLDNTATHNWIHHNIFRGMGGFSVVQDGGLLFQIGSDSGGTALNSNNTIEYNHIYNGAHHVFGVNNGKYNVIRHNYVHGESWWTGDSGYMAKCSVKTNGCGYRVAVFGGAESASGNDLIEDNVFGYGAQYGGAHVLTGGSGGGVTLGSPNNIYRYNDHVGNALQGLRLGSTVSGAQYGSRIYNNTFVHNGYNEDSPGTINEDDPYALAYLRVAIIHYETDTTKLYDTVVKNNLCYDNFAEDALSPSMTGYGTLYYPAIYARNTEATNTEVNNYCTTGTASSYDAFTPDADPLFSNGVLPEDSAAIKSAWSSYTVTSPDLTLQSASPAIDGGTYLTQVNDADGCTAASEDCTVLVVDDARYFQDGSWGSSLATLAPDEICISASSTVADLTRCKAISSINYAGAATADACNGIANCIILATELDFANNEYVWLYKKSDGTQVLYGDAPDYGAHERNTEGAPPTTYTVKVSSSGTGCTYSHDGEYAVDDGSTLTVNVTVNNGWQNTWSGTCSQDSGTTTRVCTPNGDDQTVVGTCTEIKVIW